jgi:hypothetical protein
MEHDISYDAEECSEGKYPFCIIKPPTKVDVQWLI